MPTTLLTGANGFVAAHILDALISANPPHTVIGSVRSALKGQQILDVHPEYAEHLSFIVVSDYAKEGTWDAAFQEHDIDYVIHTAAPLLDDPRNTDFDRDFLQPSIKGATELLKSATRYGKNVKSIAITGSVNALTTGADVETRTFNSKEWLPVTIADAIAAQNAYISYCVAKAESEKAIWAYVASSHPSYAISVLLPALIFGPPIQPVFMLKNINYSTDVFYSLFNGTYEVTPPTSFPSYIDVRDLAKAHILALTNPATENQRFLVGGLPYSSQLAVDSLKAIPELKDRLPKDNDEVVPTIKFADVEEWNKKLGLNLRTPGETFGDAARRILQLEKVLKE